MNFRFPVFLDVTGKRCVVTGAGYEVPGKVLALAEAGANTVYVNPEAAPAIRELVATGRVCWLARRFDPADLDNTFLVITDCAENAAIFAQAERKGVLCNAVDDPPHCRFSFGSVHRQGELTIAVSTNGNAPALAVRLKEQLEREVGAEYGQLISALREIRPAITARVPDFATRKALWYRIVDSAALGLFRSGQAEAAHRLIRQLLADALSTVPDHAPADDDRYN